MIHVFKTQPPELEVESFNEFSQHNAQKQCSDLEAAYTEYRDYVLNDHNEGWWSWYKLYLNSRVWKEKRHAVLQYAKTSPGMYRCAACGGVFPALEIEVHHLTYQRVGREPLFDLVAVCRGCHEQLTQWSRE